MPSGIFGLNGCPCLESSCLTSYMISLVVCNSVRQEIMVIKS